MNANLASGLLATASRVPDAIATIAEDGTQLTYAALATRVNQVSGGLTAHGVKAGDRVLYQLSNGVAATDSLNVSKLKVGTERFAPSALSTFNGPRRLEIAASIATKRFEPVSTDTTKVSGNSSRSCNTDSARVSAPSY